MSKQQPTAKELKSALDDAEAREAKLAADLIPARDRLAKARTRHQYGQTSDDELHAARITVQSLEQQHAEVAKEVRQLSEAYNAIDRVERGAVADELRLQNSIYI